MIKYIMTGIGCLVFTGVIVPLYCCLIMASREACWMERMMKNRENEKSLQEKLQVDDTAPDGAIPDEKCLENR